MVSEQEDQLNLSLCDPDLGTNPGGKITRYNLEKAKPSPKRTIEISLSEKWKINGRKTSSLVVETSNAVKEKLILNK